MSKKDMIDVYVDNALHEARMLAIESGFISEMLERRYFEGESDPLLIESVSNMCKHHSRCAYWAIRARIE